MAHPDDDQIMSGHLDEGTVHAWLDGQLPAEEATRVESHVAACATCAAQVAEARGFVAASSRILTALDGVPARVIPARRRGVQLWHVRAAAAVLIVALGTATVLRHARVPEFSPGRASTLSDSQAGVASVAAKKTDTAIAPSAAPLPAAVLPKKAAVREETPPLASKAAASAVERDQIKTSGVRDKRSDADADANVPRRAENKEKATVSGTPGASPPMPAAAPAGLAGGVVAQGVAPAAPAIAGRLAAPVPGVSAQLQRPGAGASAGNVAIASDSGAADRDVAAKVAPADRKRAQALGGDSSAFGQSQLEGLRASACVGRIVIVQSGVTDSNRQVVMATVQLGGAPSTDSRFPGFALGTVGIDTGPPAGAWTPVGRDSAILTLPVEGPGAASQARSGNADSVAPDTLRDHQVVRRRVRCAPR